MSSIDNLLAPAILGTAYAFIVLCTVAMVLRFASRHGKGAHYKSDDWTMLGAYVLYLFTMGLELKGEGVHVGSLFFHADYFQV
jgi:hypothetical protein